MIITKVIIGFVTQRFDTNTNQFLDQEFIIGSDDRHWKNADGELIDAPSVNGEEPYLNMEMIQPNSNNKPNSFEVGQPVVVTPSEDGSEPTQEFMGRVIGFKDSGHIQVCDQENNVFDCDPVQVHEV